MRKTHAPTINRGELKRLLTITRATSRYWQRDMLVILLGHDTGMRVTEMSRITVADVMYKDGRLKVEISLRGVVTKGAKQRCAYLSSNRLIQALETYISHRLEHGIGTELHAGSYRGLLASQPLIYSSRGNGMSQNTKRRRTPDGDVKEYKACDSLQSHVTRLYAKAGIVDGSSHSGRRTFAQKVLAESGEMVTVALLLGHDPANISVTALYIDLDHDKLRAIFANAV